MTKILHIGKYYPPHRGGMERHLKDLAVRQARAFSVSVIVANQATRRDTSYVDNVRVVRLARLATVASMPVCPGMTRAIRNSPADLVHLHTPNPGAALAFLLSGHRGKLIITHHADTLGRRILRKLSDPIVCQAMHRADRIIVTSSRYLQSSAELAPFRDKCRIIPLGIDVGSIPAVEPDRLQQLRAQLGDRVVLAVGRLVPYKGFDVLIRSMKYVDANLVLIGSGPQFAVLSKLVRDENMQNKVAILGRVDALTPYFNLASVFVLPSVTRAEAFGLVQLEAMAAGLPVINTNIDSGVPEISVNGQTGLTVEPGDPVALTRAIEFLLVRNDLRETYGANGKARVEAEFTAELMTQRTITVYRESLAED